MTMGVMVRIMVVVMNGGDDGGGEGRRGGNVGECKFGGTYIS
jgi:hypothetical protein